MVLFLPLLIPQRYSFVNPTQFRIENTFYSLWRISPSFVAHAFPICFADLFARNNAIDLSSKLNIQTLTNPRMRVYFGNEVQTVLTLPYILHHAFFSKVNSRRHFNNISLPIHLAKLKDYRKQLHHISDKLFSFRILQYDNNYKHEELFTFGCSNF